MPLKSQAQRRWAHSPAGQEALGGPAKVAEWERATGGRKLPERVPMSKGGLAKGHGPVQAAYAAGGPVLGRTRDFTKEPDQFTDGRLPPKQAHPTPSDYGGKGAPAKRAGGKSEKTVLPRG